MLIATGFGHGLLIVHSPTLCDRLSRPTNQTGFWAQMCPSARIIIIPRLSLLVVDGIVDSISKYELILRSANILQDKRIAIGPFYLRHIPFLQYFVVFRLKYSSLASPRSSHTIPSLHISLIPLTKPTLNRHRIVIFNYFDITATGVSFLLIQWQDVGKHRVRLCTLWLICLGYITGFKGPIPPPDVFCRADFLGSPSGDGQEQHYVKQYFSLQENIPSLHKEAKLILVRECRAKSGKCRANRKHRLQSSGYGIVRGMYSESRGCHYPHYDWRVLSQQWQLGL